MVKKIILFLFCIFTFQHSASAENNPKTNQAPIQTESQNLSNRSPTTSDVYDALIESKNSLIEMQKEKIELLNNIINWILAGLAIIATVVILFISYIQKKNLKEIEKRSKQLEIQHQQIKEIAESESFKKNLEQIQAEVSKYDEVTQTLDQKVLELDKKAKTLEDTMQTVVMMNIMNR